MHGASISTPTQKARISAVDGIIRRSRASIDDDARRRPRIPSMARSSTSMGGSRQHVIGCGEFLLWSYRPRLSDWQRRLFFPYSIDLQGITVPTDDSTIRKHFQPKYPAFDNFYASIHGENVSFKPVQWLESEAYPSGA